MLRHRKVKQLEEQLQEMQKLANDDTQSEDRRSLLMRCDRAETRARKNEEQMMENAKKFAREISELKTKLAEKDAKLAGGFGAPSACAHMHARCALES